MARKRGSTRTVEVGEENLEVMLGGPTSLPTMKLLEEYRIRERDLLRLEERNARKADKWRVYALRCESELLFAGLELPAGKP